MSQADNIREYLLASIPGSKLVSGGKIIQCRCRECSDSVNPNSAHMGINSGRDGSPFWYNCFKCGAKGILTYKKLIEWGIYDPDIAEELTEYNNSLLGSKHSKYFNRTCYHVRNTYIANNDPLIKQKVDYINNRLSTNLSAKDMADLKIVFNLIQFLGENKIQKITRDERIIEGLNRYFLGFLSVDNAYLNMRRIVDTGIPYENIDRRYINYDIFGKFDNSQRFYVVPTQINLLSKTRIPVHIAEGPFDILSIYLNIRKKENGIYASVAGSNYMNTILYILLELKLPYIEIHLYPDNDAQGNDYRMSKLISNIPDRNIPIYIHRNIYPGEKDFGVNPDHIHETIIQYR